MSLPCPSPRHSPSRAATTSALLCLLLFTGGRSLHGAAHELEKSVVLIEATRIQYEYLQPWVKRSRTTQKNGVVIAPNQILTTAEELTDLTLVRVQKGGRGKWWNAKVEWIDHHSNLALVTAADPALWEGLQPASFIQGAPPKEGLQVVRWRNGNLETRKAEFNQFLVEDGRLTFIQHLQLEASTEMQSVGWSEPLVANGRIAALATGQTGSNTRFLPAAFIQPILAAREKGVYRGLGYFPFLWQPAENPSIFKFLKLPGEPRGALVVDVPATPRLEPNLKPRDIILQIDGHDIDNQGYYADPDFGQLILEALAVRGKFAGDIVRIKLWREGKPLEIDYRLPKVDYTSKLVPLQLFEQPPEYLIAGGIIFQPLSIPLLRSFGEDWKRRAPFRLSFFANEGQTSDRTNLVIITLILPDPYNLGYQDTRFLIVDKINGRIINHLPDVEAALKSPKDGFQTIDLMRGDNLQRIVLDAASMDDATNRILARYRIPAARYLTPAP